MCFLHPLKKQLMHERVGEQRLKLSNGHKSIFRKKILGLGDMGMTSYGKKTKRFKIRVDQGHVIRDLLIIICL